MVDSSKFFCAFSDFDNDEYSGRGCYRAGFPWNPPI